jgi:hypothetical protein
LKTTTLSGPEGTLAEARQALTDVGYFVLSIPTMRWLELADGDALLSVEGSHSDAAAPVTSLGWRHRGTQNSTPLVNTPLV